MGPYDAVAERIFRIDLACPGAVPRPLFCGFRPATSCNVASDLR
jgi:hypothetical protein